jgi:hypothetical protein
MNKKTIEQADELPLLCSVVWGTVEREGDSLADASEEAGITEDEQRPTANNTTAAH